MPQTRTVRRHEKPRDTTLPRMRGEGQIEGAIAQANVELYSGGKFPGMSYEQGVIAALQWVTGRGPHPFEEE